MKPPLQLLSIQRKRRRAKRLLWSRNRYKRQSLVRQVFHLPTRRTLTYAEAQRFVDICVDGSVSRLNISEPLCVVDDCDSNKYGSVSCGRELPSERDVENVTGDSKCEQTVKNSIQVRVIQSSNAAAAPPRPAAYYRHVDSSPAELNEQVEYDIDEQVLFFILYHVAYAMAFLSISIVK